MARGERDLASKGYHSAIARKNLAGAIAAFRTAFGPPDGAAFLVKSVNAASRPYDACACSLPIPPPRRRGGARR